MKVSVLLCIIALASIISAVYGISGSPIGNCFFTMSGTNYVDIPSFTTASSSTATYTFEAMVYFNTNSDLGWYLSYLDINGARTNLGIYQRNITTYIANYGWNTYVIQPKQTWMHIAVTYDYSNGETYYVNGQNMGTNNKVKNKKILSGGRLVLGQNAIPNDACAGNYFDSYSGSNAQPWTGGLDEVRVWSPMRSDGQIASAYNRALTNSEKQSSALLLYFDFEPSSGTQCPTYKYLDTITDKSPKKQNGAYGCTNCVNDVNGEFAALWNIYTATGGSSWKYNTNWKNPNNDPTVNPCAPAAVDGTQRTFFGLVCACISNTVRVTQINLGVLGLSGNIPDVFAPFSQVKYLFMHSNQLTGSIPPSVANLPLLTHLYLRNNALTGTIPSGIGNLGNLQKVLLSGNKLNGGIPSSFQGLTNIVTLDVSNNALDGTVPDLSGASALLTLNLNMNKLQGTLPSGLINHPTLKFLNLADNKLTNAIPMQFSQNNFQSITLNNNNFKCMMPSFMYQPLQYTMNVYNNTFWCPITGSSLSVFGATCSNVLITSINPTSVLTTGQSVTVTLNVANLNGCAGIMCRSDSDNATVPATVTASTVTCTFGPSPPRQALISIYYNSSQISANTAVLSYYTTCPNNCGNNLTRGYCNQYTGQCVCYSGFSGVDCTQLSCPKNCSGHGTCNPATGVCSCGTGYTGTSCSTADLNCPNSCSGHGQCDRTTGTCACVKGFWGADCSSQACPPYNQPYCNYPTGGSCNGATGQCQCLPGWLPPNCQTPSLQCKNNCTGPSNGQCDQTKGVCTCFLPFILGVNKDCSERQCPGSGVAGSVCSGHGTCNSATGVCKCDTGYNTTADCSVFQTNCPNNCNNNGACNSQTGQCGCYAGFYGADCSSKVCPGSAPSYCSYPNGICVNSTGVCQCGANYTGTFCQINNKPCPNGCTSISRGVCNKNTGQCQCTAPAMGADCSLVNCTGGCSGHGTCNYNTGQCVCDPGFGIAPDCSVQAQTCATSCNEPVGGYCNNATGQCVCFKGYSTNTTSLDNTQCTLLTCPGNPPCNPPYGSCDSTTGLCTCAPFYTGSNCGVANHTCGGCNEPHGQCLLTNGTCQCHDNYFGQNCKMLSCLADCTAPDHGTCDHTTGMCNCTNGWQGSACDTKVCPNFCTSKDRGTCDFSSGVCLCAPAYTGPDCSLYTCSSLNYCSGHGMCNNATGDCECFENYVSSDCSIGNFSCPGGCMNGGVCNSNNGHCQCANSTFFGVNCEYRSCNPPTCSGHGVCNNATGQCACSVGWTGAACLTEFHDCPKNCSGHGICDNRLGKCSCDTNSTGVDCSLKRCPGDCSKHGKCNNVTGTCTCSSGWDGIACSHQKPNTKGIALGAALGGAGVVAAAGTAFYFIREHQIKQLKAKKAMKMKSMSSASG